MPILPIAGAAALLASGAPLKAVSSAVSSTGSAFANLLQRAVAKPNLGAEPAADSKPNPTQQHQGAVHGIDAAQLKTNNADKIESFAAQFRAYLKEAGIDPISGIDLQLDHMGKVQVVGNPFDKEKIESVLASHPELANQFRQISANASLLKAIDESVHCQQANDGDPHSLVADAPHLFSSDQASKFTIQVHPDRTVASFLDGTVGP